MYAPRSEDEVLRRDCSPDYSQEDIGDPVLEVELQPGVRFQCCNLTEIVIRGDSEQARVGHRSYHYIGKCHLGF